ncbi:MAG: hypothetical protein ACM3SR_00315 [Ignavibacteriales bacterium]
MRKIITFATVLGFIVTVSLNFTTTAKGSEDDFTISGKVLAIENGIVSLGKPNGEIFAVMVKNYEQLEGIGVGDMVKVKYDDGRVESIKKTKKKVESEPAKDDSD